MQNILLSLLLLTLVGCTTASTVRLNSDEPSASIGKKVVVALRTGESISLKVERINENSISGYDDNGASKEIRSDQIQQIEVRKFSALKTLGLVSISTAALLVYLLDHGDAGLSM